jgi:hypothetical protein
MDRYQFTYNSGTNTITNFTPWGAGDNATNAVFISGGIKEGVQGTENDIIAVATGGTSLVRYGIQNGNIIGTIPVTLNGSSYTLASIGNIIISPDGRYLYAAEAATTQNGLTGGAIDKIDLKTGAIVNQVQFQGAHDLLLENGTLYAAAYTGSVNGSSDGVWTFDSNLGTKHQMIVGGTNGLTAPTGMSFQGTTLYINQNVVPTTANSVLQYNVGSAGGTSATFISSHSSADLNFIFGSALGPDGNLYIAGLGGASGRSDPSYTDGVYEYDTTSNAFSQLIAGENGGGTTGPPGASGLYSPKYLQFSTNFVPAPDAGYGTPEPGSVALFCSLGLVGAGWARRRKRRI